MDICHCDDIFLLIRLYSDSYSEMQFSQLAWALHGTPNDSLNLHKPYTCPPITFIIRFMLLLCMQEGLCVCVCVCVCILMCILIRLALILLEALFRFGPTSNRWQTAVDRPFSMVARYFTIFPDDQIVPVCTVSGVVIGRREVWTMSGLMGRRRR